MNAHSARVVRRVLLGVIVSTLPFGLQQHPSSAPLMIPWQSYYAAS